MHRHTSDRSTLLQICLGAAMAAAVLGVHTSSLAAPQEHTQSGGATAAAPAPFLLGTDPVSGEKLGSGAVSLTYQGRELRFTSKTNAERFQRDSATYLPKIDAEIVRTQLPSYPLQTCVVSGEKLGGMGDPINYVHLNRLVRFCCPSCKDEFLKDPQAHLKKIDAAVIAEQARDYPLKT